ncbi:hypothetical protein GCM10011611_05270 [Aliidongia dinghuensis]|uniref:Uncharacterized protein n=1 Tax=Aliidongia dinghuensis TaxID=1867774 RepID=A0A8J3E1J9_9PROT|nr:hypothetical protein [Aliidongia dinghuensis]GGF02744.1 hypothetical protein GCM10011611_05270 [Aliidongia dinghuensis]
MRSFGIVPPGSWLLWAMLVLALAAAPLAVRPGNATPASPPMQRMLIGAGCYQIAGHASGPVPAYCLDQDGSTPRRGVMLGETPALGAATVSVGGETMSLATALARHVLRVEGTDAPDQLSLANTTDLPLSLCVDQPVVVMGNGIGYSRDLARVYDRIDALMSADRAPPAPDETNRHERLQQSLWSLVKAVDDKDWADRARLGGASAPPNGADCPVAGATTVLCH